MSKGRTIRLDVLENIILISAVRKVLIKVVYRGSLLTSSTALHVSLQHKENEYVNVNIGHVFVDLKDRY